MLSEAAASVEESELRAALDRVAGERLGTFIDGVLKYRRHPFVRAMADGPVVWSEGAMRVHAFGPEHGPPVLVVPSLINRGYVLDIAPDRSLVRALAAQGARVALVEWGRPGPAEEGMTPAGAVARLTRAFDAVSAGRRTALVGYCMGGLLTLALGLARRDRVSGAAFLATPWDFHAGGRAQAQALARWGEAWMPQLRAYGEVPVDVLQLLFTALDPFLAVRKFTAFAELDQHGEEAECFVAVEDWLNDGVPLPVPIAEACMAQWYGENRPGRGVWSVDGLPVRAADLDAPSIVFVPERDRIVPPASAQALGAALPAAETRTVPSGHIGMVVGRRARAELVEPLCDWLVALD